VPEVVVGHEGADVQPLGGLGRRRPAPIPVTDKTSSDLLSRANSRKSSLAAFDLWVQKSTNEARGERFCQLSEAFTGAVI
jgi:hypothetical protein